MDSCIFYRINDFTVNERDVEKRGQRRKVNGIDTEIEILMVYRTGSDLAKGRLRKDR